MRKNLISITESAILIALAITLEILSKTIPIIQMPKGGSVSLAMLPLIIIGFRRGLKYGIVSGAIFGMINLWIDGYTFHWGSFFLDYLLPFSIFGLSGVFKNKRNNTLVIIFVFISLGFLRYLFHSLSGVLFFASGFDEAYKGLKGAIFYSFIIYNLPYNFINTLIATIIAVVGKRIITLNLEEEK